MADEEDCGNAVDDIEEDCDSCLDNVEDETLDAAAIVFDCDNGEATSVDGEREEAAFCSDVIEDETVVAVSMINEEESGAALTSSLAPEGDVFAAGSADTAESEVVVGDDVKDEEPGLAEFLIVDVEVPDVMVTVVVPVGPSSVVPSSVVPGVSFTNSFFTPADVAVDAYATL